MKGIRSIMDFSYFRKEQKGLTVIEVIVSVVILSVALLPIISVIASWNRYSALQRQKNYAVSQMVSTMEQVKGAYSTAFPQTYSVPASGALDLPDDDNGMTYVCDWVYSPVSRDTTYYENHSFQVSLTVYWPKASREHQTTLSTILTSR